MTITYTNASNTTNTSIAPQSTNNNSQEPQEPNNKNLEEPKMQTEPKGAEEPKAADIAEKYETLLANQQATIDKQDKRIDSLLEQITKLVVNGAQYNSSNAKPDYIEGSDNLERPEYEPIKPEDLRV